MNTEEVNKMSAQGKREFGQLRLGKKSLLIGFAAGIFFLLNLLFPTIVKAQVVINEFSSNSDTEWVEIFNFSGNKVELNGWKLVDGNSVTSDDLSLDGCIAAGGFRLFSRGSGWLNNSVGDTITLKNQNGNSINEVIYGENGIVGIPEANQSAGRQPDGSDNWSIINSPTPTNGDCQSEVTLTPTPAAETPTSTQTQSPTSATYQINDAKDTDGNILSTVKIYVDEQYVHHYTPEALKFCDGCFCYQDGNEQVACGFGSHTIKLEKNGYGNWQETRNFQAGDNISVNPIMQSQTPDENGEATLTPSSNPTPTTKLSPVPKPTDKPKPTLETGDVLGETAEKSFYPMESEDASSEPEEENSVKSPWLAKIFLGSGLIFLASAGAWLWYTLYGPKSGGKNFENQKKAV